MNDEKWTLIDKKTQIASLLILIFIMIAIVSVFINLLMSFWSESKIISVLFIFFFLILFCILLNMLRNWFKSNKKLDNETKKKFALLVIFIIITGFFSLYFTFPTLFEKCTYLDDGTKVCGDIDDIKLLNYSIYTTAETDYTYENLGEGFIRSDSATDYYVSINLKKDTTESIDEKKMVVKFFDDNGNFLDSSWVQLDDYYFNRTSNINWRPWILSISRDSMGEKFEKVESVSFRITESLESTKNRCYSHVESHYNDERFFGTWINESGINETCTSLFDEYTFYSNGTGMTPFGKIYWNTVVYHDSNEVIGLEMYSYSFKDTPYNYSTYRVYPSFELSNNNNTLMLKAFDEDLYNRIPEGKINWWCWTTMYYTKQLT